MPSIPRLSDRFFAAYLRRGTRGFHLLRRVWLRCGGSPTIRFHSRFGAVFDLNPYGYVEGFVLRHGFYESEVFNALQSYLLPGAVFWDVGANLGLHAVTGKVTAPGVTVCAFEPVPEMLDRVRVNAALNGVALTTFSITLAATTEERAFHQPPGPNSGRGSLLPLPDIPGTLKMRVACVRADELIRTNRAPAPTVIKLDVEGAESEVLDGLGDFLKETQLRAVVFEGSPGLVAPAAEDAVGSRLCRAGFSLRRLERQEPTHHLLENYLAYRP